MNKKIAYFICFYSLITYYASAHGNPASIIELSEHELKNYEIVVGMFNKKLLVKELEDIRKQHKVDCKELLDDHMSYGYSIKSINGEQFELGSVIRFDEFYKRYKGDLHKKYTPKDMPKIMRKIGWGAEWVSLYTTYIGGNSYINTMNLERIKGKRSTIHDHDLFINDKYFMTINFILENCE